MQAPITTVWHCATQIEGVKHWWTDGQIGADAGEPIVLGDGGSLNGTLVNVLKPYVFEFTWHDEPSRSTEPQWLEHKTRSLVRIELLELAAQRTSVTLIQYAPASAVAAAAAGWTELMQRLATYAESGKV